VDTIVAMPGLHITDRQVLIYMKYRTDHTQVAAAAIAGISERSAREIDRNPLLPSQRKRKRSWRTRKDPLINIWPRALELLTDAPRIMAVTIFETLQEERGVDAVPDSVRRTLERRVADWQALNGSDKEVFFPQRHEPGAQGLSDFTVADSLGVTIAGEPLAHRLYHFRLACSGWEDAKVILRGESFTAISEGLQDALWKLGGVPVEHRTDSLSAAFKNLDRDAQADFTRRYDDLCRHYGMKATRNNPGVAHENGSIEASNGHLKRRIEQELLKRGNRDFPTLDEYRRFVTRICDRHNARRRHLVAAERKTLRELPKRRTTDFVQHSPTVTRNSTMTVDKVLYTVPPRLIGSKLEVHLFDDRLECFLGATLTLVLPRGRPVGDHRTRRIDYRHVIAALKKKPQALRNLIYRDDLFPQSAYARAWQALDAALPPKEACKIMVGLLDLAANHACENALAARLDAILETHGLPDLPELKAEFAPANQQTRHVDVAIPPPDLAGYNDLLRAEARQ
jgi:transposase InsO family protein